MSEMNSVEELRKELSVLNNANYVSKITVQRGRLIRKIMIELAKLKRKNEKDEATLEAIEKLETVLNNEIANHKAQLNRRYKKEFIDEKATVPTIVTVLPKAVGLQINKVVTCIEELIAARNNKQRIFGVLALGKALGMTVATPIIYAGKFIKDHWYLILLLLKYLNLPNINGNKPNNNNNNSSIKGETEPSLVTVTDPVPETVEDKVTVPNTVVNPLPNPVRKPNLNPKPVIKDDSNIVPSPVTENPVSSEVLEENSNSISSFAKEFMETLERDYSFFIKELHPEITVVHSAEEFAEYYKNATGSELDLKDAVRVYSSNNNLRPINRYVIWPEVDETCKYFSSMNDLMNYIMSGEDKALLDYFNRYTIPTEVSFDLANSGIVNNLAETLGISVGAAFTIILLKYAIEAGITITSGVPVLGF